MPDGPLLLWEKIHTIHPKSNKLGTDVEDQGYSESKLNDNPAYHRQVQ